MTARALAVLALGLTGLGACAAPAAAAGEPPRCEDEAWSRPGRERVMELVCWRADRVRVGTQPAHATVTGLHYDGSRFRFRLQTRPDASQSDELRLELDGPAGSASQTVRIVNVPLSQNTAPRCEPVSTARRTQGTLAPTVSFHVDCADAEHDDVTLHGGGPGTHTEDGLVSEQGGSGRSVPMWYYVPTILAGEEQTTYWGIDSEGLRSADAAISVKVGATVDRLPECHTNLGSSDPAVSPVWMRPGATRSFNLICNDADGDALEPRVVHGPQRGRLTAFSVGGQYLVYAGGERWIDVTYVPGSVFEGYDPFRVQATGPHGPGPVSEVRMTARALPENGGGGCGWSPATTASGQSVVVTATCTDDDGDALAAEIVDAPDHGSVQAPAIVATPGGVSLVGARYTPSPGFAGTDQLTLRVTDGHGTATDMPIDIAVNGAGGPTLLALSAGPDADGWFGGTRVPLNSPAIGQAPPVTPVAQARRALGTSGVRLVKRLGQTRVYAATRAPRAAPTVRALAVTCPVRCRVDSAVSLAGGKARSSTVRVAPGRARSLTVRVSRAQRARIRRSATTKASFRITARPAAGKRRSGRVSVRVRR